MRTLKPGPGGPLPGVDGLGASVPCPSCPWAWPDDQHAHSSPAEGPGLEHRSDGGPAKQGGFRKAALQSLILTVARPTEVTGAAGPLPSGQHLVGGFLNRLSPATSPPKVFRAHTGQGPASSPRVLPSPCPRQRLDLKWQISDFISFEFLRTVTSQGDLAGHPLLPHTRSRSRFYQSVLLQDSRGQDELYSHRVSVGSTFGSPGLPACAQSGKSIVDADKGRGVCVKVALASGPETKA